MIEIGEQRQGRKRSMSPEGVAESRQNGGPLLAVANGTTTTSLNGKGPHAPPEPGLINKKLPKELLLKIFSFLDIVSLCRFVFCCC